MTGGPVLPRRTGQDIKQDKHNNVFSFRSREV
jgi:hypothetical protein